MNKRKEREDKENQDEEQKRRQLTEFRPELTMDVAEARGYLYAGLVANDAMLKALFKLFLEGNKGVKYMGDPLLSELEKFLFSEQRQEDTAKIFYTYFENGFYVDREPKGNYSVEVATIGQLRTIVYNRHADAPPAVQEPEEDVGRVPTQVDDDDDNDIQIVAPATPQNTEIDKFDLKMLWDDMKEKNKSNDELFEVSKKFVDDFLELPTQQYASREMLKFNKLSIWTAIRLKLDDMSDDKAQKNVLDLETNTISKQQSPVFVYFDSLSGNMFASINAGLARGYTLKVFASNDLLLSFALKTHIYVNRNDYYEENVEKLKSSGLMAPLLYQLKRLTIVLLESFPELDKNDLQEPYAVVFYPAVCEFARIAGAASLEKTAYIDLAARVQRAVGVSNAIVLKRTDQKIFSSLWQSSIPVPIEKYTSQEELKQQEKWRNLLERGRLNNFVVENPRDDNSKTIWNGTSPYNQSLNVLYSSEMLALCLPRTMCGEILYMTMIIYRQFLTNRRLYGATIRAYKFFEVTENSIVEQLIEYCAAEHELDRDDVGVEKLGFAYERFMIDCIILAAEDQFRVPSTMDWESRVPISFSYLIGTGDFQAVLQSVAEESIPPFGQLEEARFSMMRDTMIQYTDSAFGVREGAFVGLSYAQTLKLNSNIDTVVLFELRRQLNAVDKAYSRRFDMQRCDVEMLDDLLNRFSYAELPQIYLHEQKTLISYVDGLRTTRGNKITILFDKLLRETHVFEFEDGPIALREIVEIDKNSVILYAPVKPNRRVREQLLPISFRRVPKTQEQLDDDNERGEDSEIADRERILREAEEARRRRGEVDSGSFAKGTHVNQGYIDVVRRALYPAQHANTVWREMMYLGVTVYRKFVEFPQSEDKIGKRSVFEKWTNYVQTSVAQSENRDQLMELIRVARLRLLLFLEIFGNKMDAYDRFLNDLLKEAIDKADEGEVSAVYQFVKDSRRYIVNEGRFENTLEYLYMNYYKHVGPVPEKNKRFVDVFNKFVDEPSVTDDMFSDEILIAFRDLVPREEKDIEEFAFNRVKVPLQKSKMFNELLKFLKQKAPVFFNDKILSSSVDEAIALVPRGMFPRLVLALFDEKRKDAEYGLGIVPQNAPSGFMVKYTNGTSLPYPTPLGDKVFILFIIDY